MKALLVTIGILLLLGCSSDSDWTALVYPDIENIPNTGQVQNYAIGNYRTFEECQTAAIERLRSNYTISGHQGDYQCGYKCSLRNDFGNLFICEEMRK